MSWWSAFAQISVRHNNALHQTKRVGAPASQAVVEARFAGERGCCAGMAVNPR